MAELETTHIFKGHINKVFAALGEYPRYPEFIPGVTGIKVLPPPPGSQAKCLVRYEINIVKTFFYTIEMFDNGKDRIWWTMTESNLMKKNDGEWSLTDRGGTETHATYKLDVTFKGLVPSMITDQVAKANLPGMFAGFQKLIDTMP
jgi:ribosome-associated toxin RatA of RatAB toxin-antitoxin module